uniref:Aquaporin family protein n=1 Tax=Thermomicrobium roseum TaxID=500 RepID=A0A7C1XHS1_THERO
MQQYLAEFCGTLLLVLLTNGTVATARLARSHGEGSSWFTITAGSALAVMIAVGVSFSFSGGHINPAVTLALAIWGFFPLDQVPGYLLAQMSGGFLGAVLVWIAFWRHWEVTSDAAVQRSVFCTTPAIRSWPANLLAEGIGTAVLAFGVTLLARGVLPMSLAPWWVGSLVFSIGLALGGTTGFALNPARDAAPRFAYTVLPIPGRGDPDWKYGWIPVVGPIGGAVIGVGLTALLSRS